MSFLEDGKEGGEIAETERARGQGRCGDKVSKLEMEKEKVEMVDER